MKMEAPIESLKDNLKEMPKNFKSISSTMRLLYAELAVGSYENATCKFRQLRDDTRKDAMVYLKVVLPNCTKLVASLKDYFENYTALTFDKWKKYLEDIRDEIRTYKKVAETCVKMHEGMLASLNKRECKAKILITEFKDLQMEYEKQKEELDRKVQSKKSWSSSLVGGAFVTQLSAETFMVNAAIDVAKLQHFKVNKAAAIVVAETLIPAIKDFVEGLIKAAGFFQVVEIELDSFSEKADSYVESHYTTIKKEAKELKFLCQSFYSVIPSVLTDFQSIPFEETDTNYVDKWLKNILEDIEKKKKVEF
ncbi:uncharacterized protein LOC124450893 isoform X1 [Xenia sp. Carnegie-2017]|uniref:uncharacterized protein LOC124450893 isoform X1 n=1 Tax=Xenia sp. Carnegie-2017 TaxID=2897299 RepID=UPI001F04508E|nr:uncharacterized protein LOC124450893 isoform X1 [Xenia sp. Carnegie-2017]